MPNENDNNGENGKTEEPSDREFAKLNLEYQECVSSSRFHVGIRFSYFVSFTTFFFLLIGAFHYVWTAETKAVEQLKIGPFLYVWATEPSVFGKLKPGIMLAIAVFGLYTFFVAISIERRNYQLYRAADKRAGFLEERMGIKDGIRKVYTGPVPPYCFLKIPLRHTVVIVMFYGAVILIWFGLILLSVYEILF